MIVWRTSMEFPIEMLDPSGRFVYMVYDEAEYDALLRQGYKLA